MIPHVDLCRDKKAKFAAYATYRCAVKCRECNWTGYRQVGITVNVGQHIDPCSATQAIKGTSGPQYMPCPQCEANVVYLCLSQKV